MANRRGTGDRGNPVVHVKDSLRSREESMSYSSELPERTLLKPSEVASFFNVSPKTVYLWHDMGRIEGIKIRTSLRIFVASLKDLLRKRI